MIGTLADNVARMAELFTEIAAGDPLSAILIVIGNFLIVGSVLVFGYLSLGAAADVVIPDSAGRVHRPRG